VKWKGERTDGQTDNPVPRRFLHSLPLFRPADCRLYTPAPLYARKCLPQFIYPIHRFASITPRSTATHKPTRGQADTRTNFHNSHPCNPRVVIPSAVRVNTPTVPSPLNTGATSLGDSLQPKCWPLDGVEVGRLDCELSGLVHDWDQARGAVGSILYCRPYAVSSLK
jgi:hypothetical protein